MTTLLQDLRYTVRLLRRSPGFTAAAIIILALGIGANSAIFSLVHELLWSARPYPDADRVVQLYTEDTKHPGSFRLASYPVYRDLAAQVSGFDGLLAYQLTMVGIGENGSARRAFAAIVSANYFSVLGVNLAAGRAFLPSEEKPGANIPVAIASYQYWRKTGFDPGLVGRTVRINECPFTVVGIAPEHFTGTMMLFGTEFYFPLGNFDQLTNDFGEAGHRGLEHVDARPLFLLGRIRAGDSIESVNTSLRTIAERLASSYPEAQKDQTMFVARPPRLGANTNPSNESQIKVLGSLLLGMSGMVLLVACLNLANMLLARGTARRKEIAVRLALGGARHRLVRQLLTEGFVLALGGSAAGLLLAHWSASLLVNSLGALVPFEISLRGALNPAVLAATLGFCSFATVAFALGPALTLTRRDFLGDLKAQTGQDPTPRRRRWLPRHPLVVVQLALSLALLMGAGLFVRSAFNAAAVDTGFRANDTLIAEVDAGLGGYGGPRGRRALQAVSDRLAALPGVEACALGALVPMGNVQIGHPVRRAGINVPPDARPATAAEGRAYNASWTSVGADYFRAMGLPLLRGRAFTPAEASLEGGAPVVIIDEILARQLFPGADALGQRIQVAGRDGHGASANAGMEIVGIVRSTRWTLFSDEPEGSYYQPFVQAYQSNAHFHVRPADPSPAAQRALAEAIRREIRAAAPGLPVFGVKTYARHLDESAQLWLVRAGATTFGLFGSLALLLAVIGIYGVKAYSVSRRTREIGIRMALGAEPGAVRRMILQEGAAMTVAGLGLGLLLGIGVGRACSSMLYQVAAIDPFVFTLAPAVLAVAALLASWFPARRATRVDPMVALRAE